MLSKRKKYESPQKFKYHLWKDGEKLNIKKKLICELRMSFFSKQRSLQYNRQFNSQPQDWCIANRNYNMKTDNYLFETTLMGYHSKKSKKGKEWKQQNNDKKLTL